MPRFEMFEAALRWAAVFVVVLAPSVVLYYHPGARLDVYFQALPRLVEIILTARIPMGKR